MLFSLAMMLLIGMLFGSIFEWVKMPRILGMLLAGIVVGPFLDPMILSISPQLRQIALIIILMRSGLGLKVRELKQVGRPALLMCFLPACLEIVGMICIAPKLLNISLLEAAIMGSVVAAVSPAIIVPRMLKLIKSGHGTTKGIPQMIMASASVDDVFVIVLFGALIGVTQGETLSVHSFIGILTSILLGLGVGIFSGTLFQYYIKKFHCRDSMKVLLLCSIAFLFVSFEQMLGGIISFSGLLAVMAMGATLRNGNATLSDRLSVKFEKIWIGAELLLFVLVGAALNLAYVWKAGVKMILVLLVVLVFRSIGVFFCLIKTHLNRKEKMFSVVAFLPKATVQAAIGTIPLALGLNCGNMVLTMAVLSILITAPVGAICIDYSYDKLLTKQKDHLKEHV